MSSDFLRLQFSDLYSISETVRLPIYVWIVGLLSGDLVDFQNAGLPLNCLPAFVKTKTDHSALESKLKEEVLAAVLLIRGARISAQHGSLKSD